MGFVQECSEKGRLVADNSFAENYLLQNDVLDSAGGLVLSQLLEITGTEAPLLHSWIRKGCLPKPNNKRYGKRHVARVLIVTLLKEIMSFQNILDVLNYINGDVNDLSDNVIDEPLLYFYILKIHNLSSTLNVTDEKAVDTLLLSVLADFKSDVEGGKEKVFAGLKIVLLAAHAGEIKMRAAKMAEVLRQVKRLGIRR